MKRKKIIISLLAIIIIVIALIIWKNTSNKTIKQPQEENDLIVEKYVDILEDGTKLNKSNKLHETKNIEGLEITEIQLTHQNGISVIVAKVTNTTDTDVELTPVEVTLYDDENKVLEVVEGVISPVNAGESVQLNMGVSADYANTYDLKIVKNTK